MAYFAQCVKHPDRPSMPLSLGERDALGQSTMIAHLSSFCKPCTAEFLAWAAPDGRFASFPLAAGVAVDASQAAPTRRAPETPPSSPAPPAPPLVDGRSRPRANQKRT